MIASILILAAVAQGGLPNFREEAVDPAGGIGYAITVADVNADGKPDIVAATHAPEQVVWYENPGWKKRVMVAQKLPVCLQPLDVDGDGKTEMILGADWQPGNRKAGGTVWLLRRPDDLEKPWTPIKIDEEPTMHRMRLAAVDGKKELVCSPLHGREGKATVLFILKRPSDPFTQPWTREIVDDAHNIEHNVWPMDWDGDGKDEILLAALEGVFILKRGAEGKWQVGEEIGKGDPVKKGAGEIKAGRLKNGKRWIATVEPWHGHSAVVYTPGAEGWKRQVLVESHKGGHAIWAADLTGTGVDSVIAGFRGPPEGKPGEWKLYLLHPTDAAGETWEKKVLDDKIGVEDAIAADFNGDGRIDIAAVGRHTKDVKVYWNEGK